ncbi:hypothetical protein C8R44DRAFT_739838 [Mycena epipterygia]|nr:hypothetical protein C8R44DRAFT_739838 [Mycena epipterygia]
MRDPHRRRARDWLPLAPTRPDESSRRLGVFRRADITRGVDPTESHNLTESDPIPLPRFVKKEFYSRCEGVVVMGMPQAPLPVLQIHVSIARASRAGKHEAAVTIALAGKLPNDMARDETKGTAAPKVEPKRKSKVRTADRIADGEVHIHDLEKRVNIGWPENHLGEKVEPAAWQPLLADKPQGRCDSWYWMDCDPRGRRPITSQAKRNLQTRRTRNI